jgi:hypothetical protein
MDLSRNGQSLHALGARTAGDEPGGTQTSTAEIEDRFCWDHGYHIGPCCPRCRREIEELGEGISKSGAERKEVQ